MTGPTRRRLALGAILALALGLRLAHWWAVRELPFVAWPVMDSAEYHRWARELAAGDWLGSEPFFQAPLYPYLLGLVYALVGVRIDAVYLLQIGLAVAGCWALWRAGRNAGGAGAGLAAAGLAAVYGPFVFHDVLLLKESVAVTLVAFLLWRLGVLRQRPSAAGWLVAGILLGLLALLRENVFLLLPLLLPLAWRRGGSARRGLGRAAACVLGLFLVLLPVGLRNMAVGGGFLLTTYQAGTNLYIGNNPEADGTYRPIVPGKQIPSFERGEPTRLAEAALGRELEPREVSRYWLGRVAEWALAEPGAFLRLQLRKMGMFWSWYEWPDAVDYYWMARRSPVLGFPMLEFGGLTLLALVGLWRVRRRPGPWLPAMAWAAGWTLSVVPFFLFSRYRLPVAPSLVLLAAVPVARWGRALAARRWRRGAVGVGAVTAALLLPHLVGFAPRTDLVEYNRGRLLAERGRESEAAAAYRRAAAANPEFALPLLELGRLAGSQGRPAPAARWLERAVAVEPGSDDAWANLGAARLALGRVGPARAALDRALELNPEHPSALHNRALVALARGEVGAARRLALRLGRADPAAPELARLRERIRAATEGE